MIKSNKRVKVVDKDSLEIKEDTIAKDIKDVKSLVQKLTSEDVVTKTRQLGLDMDTSEKTDDGQVDQILAKCKTIGELNEHIGIVNIVKENAVKDDQDGYYCEVCFDGTKPKYSIQQPGVFLFDKTKDDTTIKKMSKALRHLKSHIKKHVESKIHLQKLEILQVKTQKQKERSSRLKIIGHNVFRTRYNGIKQA